MERECAWLKMSVDDAKELGKKVSAFLVSFRAEILESGMEELEVRRLLEDVTSAGDCTTGWMCRIST